MKIARYFRFAITKFVRFWKPRVEKIRWQKEQFGKSIGFILEPLQKFKHSSREQNNSNEKKKQPPPSSEVHQDRNEHENETDHRKNTPRRIGEALFKAIELCALIAAVITAWVIYEQLGEMRQDRTLDQRAWIYIEVRDNNAINSGGETYIRATIINSGKTPAMVKGCFSASAENTNSIPRFDPKVSGEAMVINPNSSGIAYLPIRQLEMMDLINNVPFYVYGTVYYYDIFGKEHWSQCCFSVTDKGKTVTRTLLHNSCDDLENAKTN